MGVSRRRSSSTRGSVGSPGAVTEAAEAMEGDSPGEAVARLVLVQLSSDGAAKSRVGGLLASWVELAASFPRR
jgi:hypothetical protein